MRSVEHKIKNIYKSNLFWDALIALIIFMISFWVAYFEISAYRLSGKKQFFYQLNFEPAVSLACGKGFGVHNPPVGFRDPYFAFFIDPPNNTATDLADFLKQNRDYFDCSQLPKDITLQKDPPQKLWYYLISTVGWLWKITGISWPAVDKLVAFLFALSMTLCYGIFRLGMNRFFALPLTLLLCGSSVQLDFLPWLRDYSKATFMLFIFFLLGVFVKEKLNKHVFLILSAILGLVLGIGYGFRTDLLVTMPIIMITFLFLLPNTIHYFRKITGLMIIAGLFVVVAEPIIWADFKAGSCKFDNSLQGFMRPFDNALKIQKSSIYEIGYVYNDFLSSALVGGYADQFLHLDLDSYLTSPTTTHYFCTPTYDKASFSLLKNIIATFPADILLRGYSSMNQVINLGFQDCQASVLVPTNNSISLIYKYTRPVLGIFQNYGIILLLLTTFFIAIFRLRVAIFLLLFAGYFASYPAIQFDPRHFFHLEFISLWLIGFLCYQAFYFKRTSMMANTNDKLILRCIIAGVLITSVCAGYFLMLTIARTVQTKSLKSLVAAYESSEKKSLTKSITQLNKDAQLIKLEPFKDTEIKKYYATEKMLLIELGGGACNKNAVDFTLEYEFDPNIPPHFNFSKKDNAILTANEKTLIYAPVFQGPYFRFKGVSVKNTESHCIGNIYEVNGLHYPLYLFLKLPPDWYKQLLYQTYNVY